MELYPRCSVKSPFFSRLPYLIN